MLSAYHVSLEKPSGLVFPVLLGLVFPTSLEARVPRFLLVTAPGLVFPTLFSPGTRVSLFRFFGIPFSSRLGFDPHFIVPCAFRFRVFRFGFSSILLGARVPHLLSGLYLLVLGLVLPTSCVYATKARVPRFLIVTASGLVFPAIFAPRDSRSRF